MESGEGQVVAEGTGPEGISWSLLASRTGLHELKLGEGELLTMFLITDADGHLVSEGGGGGDMPGPDQMMSVGVSSEAMGVYGFEGYAHSDVRHVILTSDDGRDITVPLHDSPAFPEVQFIALLLPAEVRLASATGFDGSGRQLVKIFF